MIFDGPKLENHSTNFSPDSVQHTSNHRLLYTIDYCMNGDVTHVGEVQRLRAQPVPASGGGEAPQRVQLSDQTERFIWREGQH